MVPLIVRALALEPPLNLVFRRPLADGRLDFMCGRVVRIDAAPADVALTVDGRGIRVTGARADAVVRASPADLAALALGRADADTLFFQRRLLITGDTALGLELRNFLEAMPPPWPVAALQRILATRRD